MLVEFPGAFPGIQACGVHTTAHSREYGHEGDVRQIPPCFHSTILDFVDFRLHYIFCHALTHFDFPAELWTRIRINNVIEQLNREIHRRTRVAGAFPDGDSILMLVCAKLCHVAGIQWGNKKYMNMWHLEVALDDTSIAS